MWNDIKKTGNNKEDAETEEQTETKKGLYEKKEIPMRNENEAHEGSEQLGEDRGTLTEKTKT